MRPSQKQQKPNKGVGKDGKTGKKAKETATEFVQTAGVIAPQGGSILYGSRVIKLTK